jgi:ATP-dependent Clp protease ATP-binding subunit ClpC
MFERYNGQARRVIFFARYAASQSVSPAIETEHLLLGLVREAGPEFARLAPISLEDVRERIPRKILVESPSLRIQMPLSSECKRILGYSAEEANDLDHRYIGVEHLLLGILRENTCRAALVLSELGVQLEQVRLCVLQGTRQSIASDSATSAPSPAAVEIDRDAIHALINQLPERMLLQIKEVVDQMLWSSQREQPSPHSEGTVVKGTFSPVPVDQSAPAETSSAASAESAALKKSSGAPQ